MKLIFAIFISAIAYADTLITTTDGKQTLVPGDIVKLEVLKPEPTTVPTKDLPGWKLSYTDDFTDWRWSDWQFPQGFQYEQSWVAGTATLANSILDLVATRGAADSEMAVGWAQLSTQPKAVQTYGKYLVRMRADKVASVPVAVAALLWPADPNAQWPNDGEIDFAEDFDGTRQVHAFSHFADASGNEQTANDAPANVSLNDWHTWGVEWTPKALNYTLDGHVWASVTDARAIPTKPMYLGFVQACHVACPPGTVHWQMDWVAVYSYSP